MIRGLGRRFLQHVTDHPVRPYIGASHTSDVLTILKGLHHLYPNIEAWFDSKVVPGLVDGSRMIFERRGRGLDGFVIAKRTYSERKICTLWVSPDMRRQGLASEMLAEAADWLGTAFPLITVCEERLPLLHGLFTKHNYVCTGSISGPYREQKKEFLFNGWL